MKRSLFQGIINAFLVGVSFVFFKLMNPEKTVERYLEQALINVKKVKVKSPHIVYITIDEKTLSVLGRYPFDRYYFIEVLKKIPENKPVAIDIFFTESDRHYIMDSVLNSILRRKRAVVGSLVNKKPVYDIANGISKVFVDRDMFVRKVPLKIYGRDAFLLKVVQLYTNSDVSIGRDFVQLNKKKLPVYNGFFYPDFSLVDNTEEVSFVKLFKKGYKLPQADIYFIGNVAKGLEPFYKLPDGKDYSGGRIIIKAFTSLISLKGFRVVNLTIITFIIVLVAAFSVMFLSMEKSFIVLVFPLIPLVLYVLCYIFYIKINISSWFYSSFFLVIGNFFLRSLSSFNLLKREVRRFKNDYGLIDIKIPDNLDTGITMIGFIIDTLIARHSLMENIIGNAEIGVCEIENNVFTIINKKLQMFFEKVIGLKEILLSNTNLRKEIDIKGYTFYINILSFGTKKRAVVIDITTVKRLKQEKQNVLDWIAHQLKTPLTTIKGYTQILNRKYREEEKLGIILKDVDCIVQMIERFLYYSRLGEGKIRPIKQPFYWDELVEEVVEILSKQAHEREIVIYKDVSHISLFSDRLLLREVLIILLDNAIKYNKPGGSIHIKSEIPEEEGYFYFSVKDTGEGMDEERMKFLFTPFVSKGKGGTGLGMVIVKEIVNLLNGCINVKSEKFKGTEVKICLREY